MHLRFYCRASMRVGPTKCTTAVLCTYTRGRSLKRCAGRWRIRDDEQARSGTSAATSRNYNALLNTGTEFEIFREYKAHLNPPENV